MCSRRNTTSNPFVLPKKIGTHNFRGCRSLLGCNLMNMPIVSPERDLPTPGRGTRMIRFSAGSTLALTLALIAGPAFAATSHHASKSSTVRRVGHRIRHRMRTLWPARHCAGAGYPDTERAHSRKLSDRRTQRPVGLPDRNRHAEVPGGSWLADQADAGFARADCAWPWPQHRKQPAACRRTPTGLPLPSPPKPEHWPPCTRSRSKAEMNNTLKGPLSGPFPLLAAAAFLELPYTSNCN